MSNLTELTQPGTTEILMTFILPFVRLQSVTFNCLFVPDRSALAIFTHKDKHRKNAAHYSCRASPSVIGQITENLFVRSHERGGGKHSFRKRLKQKKTLRVRRNQAVIPLNSLSNKMFSCMCLLLWL